MENLQDLNYNNAVDIANGSIGILRYMIYNKEQKKYRYEYYKVKVVGNKYFGTLLNHTFRVEVLEVLNGTKRFVGDIITRNGKQLYKNYHETRQASYYCRNEKHRQKQKLGVV